MEENNILPQDTTAQVVDIQFRPGQKIYYFDPNGIACKTGDHVIIDTARGPEYGICTAGNHAISQREIVAPLRPVLRFQLEQPGQVLLRRWERSGRSSLALLPVVGRSVERNTSHRTATLQNLFLRSFVPLSVPRQLLSCWSPTQRHAEAGLRNPTQPELHQAALQQGQKY